MNAKNKVEEVEDETVELDVSDEEMARRYPLPWNSFVIWAQHAWAFTCALLLPRGLPSRKMAISAFPTMAWGTSILSQASS